ncbi:MAG: hypothetical protein WBP23_04645 [Candidatus Saccharimonadales bacterium]
MNDKSSRKVKLWTNGIAGRCVCGSNTATICPNTLGVEDILPVNSGLYLLQDDKNKFRIQIVAIAINERTIDGPI